MTFSLYFSHHGSCQRERSQTVRSRPVALRSPMEHLQRLWYSSHTGTQGLKRNAKGVDQLFGLVLVKPELNAEGMLDRHMTHDLVNANVVLCPLLIISDSKTNNKARKLICRVWFHFIKEINIRNSNEHI